MAGKFADKKISVLALQGDVSLHVQALARLGIPAALVKMPAQLAGLDGLIIPGGESTSLLKLAEPISMLPAIIDFAQSGGAILGTCAGAIVLAAKVTSPTQPSLKLIDMTIQRNGYGRQIDSSEAIGQLQPPVGSGKLPMTFIRAPRITATGLKVKILATYQGEPVAVQQANIMATTFHPELQADTTVYEYWLDLVLAFKEGRDGAAIGDSTDGVG